MNDPDIIFFGGTFDPPHTGHADCIRLALDRFTRAKLIVIPAKVPATTGSAEKIPNTAFDLRVDLCKVAFTEHQERLAISKLEATLPTPNYSFSTIIALKKIYPGQRLAMMLGMDQFENFLAWKNPRDILAAADLIVVSRTGDAPGKAAENFAQTENQLRQEFGASFFETSGKIYYLDGTTSPASSSELRKCLENSSKVPDGWLNPAVASFIKNKKIYQNKDLQ